MPASHLWCQQVSPRWLWKLPSSGMWRRVVLLVTITDIPSSRILPTLKMEAMYYSETSFLSRPTSRHISEGANLQVLLQNLKNLNACFFMVLAWSWGDRGYAFGLGTDKLWCSSLELGELHGVSLWVGWARMRRLPEIVHQENQDIERHIRMCYGME
jgi:hypothetical protein